MMLKRLTGALFRARRAQGATLDELARSYNVSRATISRLGA
jgi:transcriptional regulator with XRE-family HTH domain